MSCLTRPTTASFTKANACFGCVAAARPRGAALRATGLALSLLTALGPTPAFAQAPPSSASPEPAPAQRHDAARAQFEQALTLYRAGQYAAALEHLENAAKLDPTGKDLFFNLALVHEKLGQLGDAITALERFRELEPDAAERERARLTIERLRGAAETTKPDAAPQPCPTPAPATPPPSRGETSGANPVLVGAASLAAVSLLAGVVFSAKALSDDVAGARTSPELTLEQLRARGRRAEREALVADIAFALGLASAGTFAGVWLLTPNDPARGAGITLRSYF